MPEYQIDVFIWTSGKEGHQNRISQTKEIFKCSTDSHDIVIEEVKTNPLIAMGEFITFKQCAEQKRPGSYMIIVKDTSSSTTSSQHLWETIYWALREASSSSILEGKSFDVMWMSKWMDDCAKHETINTDPRGMSLVVTCAPYGTQCLLFSVSGINKIIDADYPEKDISFSNYLNVGVRNNKLVGIAIHPSPIKFDTNYVRNSSIEYAKSVECADVKGEILTQKKQSNLTFFIMIVVIIVILVAIYVLIKYGSKISDAYERSAMSINKEGKVIV